jgi:hypothetical protein
MPLNKKAIFEALNRTPLCHGHLIKRAGLAIEYCAMGALARDVGATNEELMQLNIFDPDGRELWKKYGSAFQNKFGIESLQQFQSLMSVNDATQFSTRRNEAVMKHVDAPSPDEINEIIQSPDESDNAPTNDEGSEVGATEPLYAEDSPYRADD